MLASNQPYQRVDDGVGAGFIGGAVAGGAMAGSAHMWGAKGLSGLRSLNDGALNKAERAVTNIGPRAGIGDMAKAASGLQKAQERHGKIGKVLDGSEKLHGKAFGGGWKGKALAYGGSVLAGGILGAGMDAMND